MKYTISHKEFMHNSVISFLKQHIHPQEIVAKRVLEVGSMNVNGTARPLFIVHAPREYIGVDASSGKGVDKICKAEDVASQFGPRSFEVVLSTEMLEHAYEWKSAVNNMKEVLAPGGILFVTTRSPGFKYHGFPHDYWRFTFKDFSAIFQDMIIKALVSDPQTPGIFIKAQKPPNFVRFDLSKTEVGKVVCRNWGPPKKK